MKSGLLTVYILICLTAGILLPIQADTIQIKNGSQIVGKVLSIEQNKLKIATDFAGTLEVAQDQIVSITTVEPIFVEFDGGNSLYGVITSETPGDIRIVAEDGEFRSKIENMTASWQLGEDSPSTRELKAELAAKERKWVYSLSAELAGTSGNTDSLDTGIGFKAELKSPKDKLNFYADYRYGHTENEVSTDMTKGGVRYESNFNEKYFWYVRDELGRDHEQDLDLYNVVGLGVGRYLIKNDNQQLALSAGMGYRYEDYGNGTTISVPAGDFGLYHDYLTFFGKIYTELQMIPSFDDLDDYRINHESGFEFPIGETAMKIRAGVGNRYHSMPLNDNNKLDSIYFSRLVWSWK